MCCYIYIYLYIYYIHIFVINIYIVCSVYNNWKSIHSYMYTCWYADFVHIYIYINICMHVHISTFVFTYACIYIRVNIYNIYTVYYLYIYIYIFFHFHTQTQSTHQSEVCLQCNPTGNSRWPGTFVFTGVSTHLSHIPRLYPGAGKHIPQGLGSINFVKTIDDNEVVVIRCVLLIDSVCVADVYFRFIYIYIYTFKYGIYISSIRYVQHYFLAESLYPLGMCHLI